MSISREPVSDASPMIRIMLVIALVWLALMPPFFTDGEKELLRTLIADVVVTVHAAERR